MKKELLKKLEVLFLENRMNADECYRKLITIIDSHFRDKNTVYLIFETTGLCNVLETFDTLHRQLFYIKESRARDIEKIKRNFQVIDLNANYHIYGKRGNVKPLGLMDVKEYILKVIKHVEEDEFL